MDKYCRILSPLLKKEKVKKKVQFNLYRLEKQFGAKAVMASWRVFYKLLTNQ